MIGTEDLKKEIQHLKKEKHAVILAHYYVTDEVQEIADYIGIHIISLKSQKIPMQI